MSKFTAFQLFIRQALLYPLTSPFLPQEVDVRFGTSYAAGQKTGTLYPGTAPLEWQTDQNLQKTWADAIDYALHLEADGVTVNEDPQNIWRLPTEAELMNALVESYLPGGSTVPGGFGTFSPYWSSSEIDVNNAWGGEFLGFLVTSSQDLKTELFLTRCVKI
jgi:hypothetical protein